MIKEDIEKFVMDHMPFRKWEAGVDWVQYSGTWYDNKEYESIILSLMKGWFGVGNQAMRFEQEFSRHFNKKHGIFVNSGSSANLLMLSALKSKNGYNMPLGTKVICPIAGFPTTINPIYQVGFEPVFVDIELDSLNIDTTIAHDVVDRNTDIKAMIFAHALGNCPDMGKVMEIVKTYDLIFLEDCCDALGSIYNGHQLGSYGVMASCSFAPAHHISTGVGGMVCANDDKLEKVMRSLASWGRSCFTENAPVYTKEGVKKISEIVVGDEVYTHLGNYKKVYEILNKQYNGDLCTIKSKGKEPIVCTEDHPFYVLRDSRYEWVEAKDIKDTDYLLQKKPVDLDVVDNLEIEYITPGGVLKLYNYPIEEDIMRLIGYFLAEGNLSSGYTSNGKKGKKYIKPRYRTDFSFSIKEEEYIEDVVFLMRKYFNTAVCKRIRHGGITLSFNGHQGFLFFNKYCGRKAYNIKLPWYFCHLDNKYIKQLLKGYWRGDGHDDFQSYIFSSVSKTLSEQVRYMLSKLGIVSTIRIRTKDKHTPSVVNGKKIEQKHDMYNIVVYRPNADLLEEILVETSLGKLERPNFAKNRIYLTKDGLYACHKVYEVTKEKVSDFTVYNLEVEEDHSYHVYGVAAHNCYCQGKASLLGNGTCGCRFSDWIPDMPNEIFDHKYIYTEIGYNMVPLELQAAIGRVQLEKLPEIIKRRNDNYNKLYSIFNNYEDVFHLHKAQKRSFVSWFGFPVTLKDGVKFKRHELCQYFESKKIQTRPYFAGNLMMQPAYSDKISKSELVKYPVANKVMKDTFFLGVSPLVTDEMIDYIGEVLKEFLISKA